MDDINAAEAQTRAKLQLVRAVLQRAGLQFAEFEFVMGMGVGVPFGPNEFVIVSAQHFNNAINITVGVLTDLAHERAAILDECNKLTQNNPGYPFYLHDAEVGWAVLVAAAFPVAVFARVEEYMVTLVRQLPVMAESARDKIAAVAGGRRFAWPADAQELLIRSTM